MAEAAEAAAETDATVERFAVPPELSEIADGFRAMVPVVRQVVEEQLKLGGNSVAVTGRYSLTRLGRWNSAQRCSKNRRRSEHPQALISWSSACV